MDEVIWKTLSVDVVWNELQIKAFLDDKLIWWRFENWLSRDFSTGHYTLEAMFENKSTLDRITAEELEKKERQIYLDNETREQIEEQLWLLYDQYDMVVTKLIWIEYSLVNVWSNRWAKVKKTATNSIDGIMAYKWFNSLSTYINKMKETNLQDLKTELLSTNETDEKEITEWVNNGWADEKQDDKTTDVVEVETKWEEWEVEPKKEEADEVVEEIKEEVVEEEKEENKLSTNALERDESLQSKITKAIKTKLWVSDESNSYVYVCDIYTSDVVYNYYSYGENGEDKYQRITYSIIDWEVNLIWSPVDVESKTEWVDKVNNFRQIMSNKTDLDDDNMSEKEGGSPEVKEDNSLGIQTNEIELLKAEFQKEKEFLENGLVEANKWLANALEVIDNLQKENNTLNEFVKTAEEITIKNGLYVETKEENKPQDKSVQKLINAGYRA